MRFRSGVPSSSPSDLTPGFPGLLPHPAATMPAWSSPDAAVRMRRARMPWGLRALSARGDRLPGDGDGPPGGGIIAPERPGELEALGLRLPADRPAAMGALPAEHRVTRGRVRQPRGVHPLNARAEVLHHVLVEPWHRPLRRVAGDDRTGTGVAEFPGLAAVRRGRVRARDKDFRRDARVSDREGEASTGCPRVADPVGEAERAWR